MQQQYVCALLINKLKELEENGHFAPNKGVTIIPSCNPFSMNVLHRFWSMDSTDINRMFPGYNKGETTQRIADAIFSNIKDYEYGIQMTSFYIPGDFVPHVRMLKTGYEDIEKAKLFGFPFVNIRTPLPFDTTLLNYNWQLWNTKAFSVYAGETNRINEVTCQQTEDAIIRFLFQIGVINTSTYNVGFNSVVIDEDHLINIKAEHAGIVKRIKMPGDKVNAGDVLSEIIDPYEGTIIKKTLSPADGIVFFTYNRPLTLQGSILYRIIAINTLL